MAQAPPKPNELVDHFMSFGMSMLERHGEFFPYGAALTADGQMVMVATDLEVDHPSSNEVIDSLRKAFKSQADNGEFDATALFFDARISNPGTGKAQDSIAVAYDTRQDVSEIKYYPYTLRRRLLPWKRNLDIEAPIQEAGKHDIFIGI